MTINRYLHPSSNVAYALPTLRRGQKRYDRGKDTAECKFLHLYLQYSQKWMLRSE